VLLVATAVLVTALLVSNIALTEWLALSRDAQALCVQRSRACCL
jgi:hypothetical protein